MAVGFSNTNKPINPRGQDASPLAYNRAKLYSGKALDFDGVNDEVNCGDINVAFSEISFAFHFNADSFSNNCIFQKESVFRFIGVNTNQIDIVLATTGNSWYSKKMTLTNLESKDYFLVATYNGSELKAYLNGVLVDTLGGYSGSVASVSQNVYVGRTNGGLYYNGKVSGARIFNTALTSTQVADLYNNPEKVVPTGVDNTALKLWLPMMEGAGTTAYDGSGNGNHGTISGATYVNGVGAPVAQSAVIDWNKGTNKAQYSEEFENSYWGLIDTQTPTANDTTAPDGQTTADKIVPSTNNAIHYIWNTSISLTGQNTISVFAKYNGYNIGIRPYGIGSGHAFANFDLQNGTILGSGGTSYDDSSITSFGDGWYRISMTMDNASTYGIIFYAVNGTTATELPTFTADGTSGFYLWGAQVNAGATLGPYVRTGATAQPTPVLLPQGLTSGRDITGVNLFENVRKQGALNLDGNSWAEVHDNASLDITTAITLECWFYDTDEGAFEGVIGKWKDATQRTYAIIKNNGSNNFLIRVSTDGSAQAGPTITNTDYGWIHLVMTYDGASIKGYKNGVYQSQAALTGSIATNDLPVEIGRYGQSTGSQYNNQIAQPRIYNRALTASEVLQNYNSGKNTYK